jgi:hypothetical protein
MLSNIIKPCVNKFHVRIFFCQNSQGGGGMKCKREQTWGVKIARLKLGGQNHTIRKHGGPKLQFSLIFIGD